MSHRARSPKISRMTGLKMILFGLALFISENRLRIIRLRKELIGLAVKV